jgi:two-component system, response regulator, stage 0 sporulation protein F
MATILVMNDEAPIRALVRTVLESVGHEVIEASNGREALALYRQRPAELVIEGIRMPELNGLDTIMELTREFLNVKVIAVSGAAGGQSMLPTAKLLGARRTLCKPIGLQELLNAVRYELAH